ncbi:MAG: SdiA-regulated domain-containing protein [Cyclobacteriaceae bacterium]
MKNRTFLFSIACLSVLLVTSCSNPEAKQKDPRHIAYMKKLKYDLNKPTKKWELPDEASEISGLTFYRENIIMFLNDEDGKVFTYDLNKEEVLEDYKFWKDNDFEGIEVVGNKIYTLQSDGDIISFVIDDDDADDIDKEETGLSDKNDTEGLGYDPFTDRLIIACKDKGDLDDKDVKGRVVYAYDYRSKKVVEEPVIQVRWEEIRDFLKDNGLDVFIGDSRKFRPSGVAVHPIDKNYYVLSSTGKSIIAFDRNGKVVLYYTVPRKILEQPEGICFDAKGNLYLSSEGHDKDPVIVQYTMRNL